MDNIQDFNSYNTIIANLQDLNYTAIDILQCYNKLHIKLN
jgi:hypothetical protein